MIKIKYIQIKITFNKCNLYISSAQNIKYKIKMAYISEEDLSGLGLGYSIIGITFVVPICFIFRQYLRFLDHLQLFYLFYLALGNNVTMFSKFLCVSWVNFNQNFYIFCQTGDLICTAGFPLSFTSCLVTFLLIMRIIVLIQKCRKEELRFEPVYMFFKAFFRWSYLPLTYYSTYYLIASAQGTENNLISSIIVFCFCVLFPPLQLIAYKVIQKQNENIWKKWLEFFSYLRLLFIGILMPTGQLMKNQSPYYLVYGIYILYVAIFMWKNLFVYPILGRVFFIVGEILMLCIAFFFLFSTTLLTDFHLDFIFITVILALDAGEYIAKAVYFVKYGIPQEIYGGKIVPEASNVSEEDQKKKKNTIDLQSFEEDNQNKDKTIDHLNPALSGNLSREKIALKKRI